MSYNNNGYGQHPSPSGSGAGGRRGGGGGRHSYGGSGYGGGQEALPRPPREDNRLRAVRDALFHLGDESDFEPRADLLKLARYVEDQSVYAQEAVHGYFRIMVTEQPHKIPLIGALLGFLVLSPQSASVPADGNDGTNGEDGAGQAPTVGAVGLGIVRDLVRAFRSYLDARLWRNVRLSLHLFAGLVPLAIIPASSLRTLLASFAAVLDEPGVPAARGDRAAICIIETLCRAGPHLFAAPTGEGEEDGARAQVDALVDAVEQYAASRKVENELVGPFGAHNDGEHDPMREESFETAVAALVTLRAQGYQRPHFLPTPLDLLPPAITSLASSDPSAAGAESSSAPSLEARAVSLPDVLVPPDEEEGFAGGGAELALAQLGAGAAPPRGGAKGRVPTGRGEKEKRRAGTGVERVGRYARWFGESVPDPPTPSSVVLRALVGDLIDLYEVNRREAARILLDLPRWLRRGTFGGRTDPEQGMFGEPPSPEKGVEQWTLYDVLVECIISTQLLLPVPPQKPIYYASLLAEICKLSPQTVAPALGKSVRRIYGAMRAGRVDGEVIRRFADWFSAHLSNFNFSWGWKEWVPDLDLPAPHPRRAFIRRVIELEVRLSYHDRIKDTLPPALQERAMDAEPIAPVFTYESDAHPYHARATALLASLRAKASAEVILANLETFKRSIVLDPSAMPEEEDGGKVNNETEAEIVVRDLVIQAVLMVGSRSFSHFLNVVERYHALLRQLSTTPAMRSALLSGAVRFWARSAQWILITFDKLLQYRIVEPADIISFIFSPPTASEVPAVVLGSSGDHVPNSLSALGVAPGGTTRDWASMGWWDVVRMTVDKVNGRVDQLRARLESLEREEAEEREKRQAAEAAGADAVAEEKPAAPALPLFPTSASLPPKPGMAADEKPSASGKKGAGGTSEEARTALEAIRAEQRRVLVGTTRGFVEVVRQLDALAPAPLDPEERDEKGWQAWWVRAWYIEFGRLFNKDLAAHRETIEANVFTDPRDGPAKETFERACFMADE